jgi:hypothetical protein
MNTHQQHQLDSLHRVQDFLNAHADVVGTLQTSEGRKQLDGATAQLQAHGLDQATADLDMAGLHSRANMLSDELKTRHMQPIAIFARAKLRGVPDFAAMAGPVSIRKRRQFVRAAKAMAVAASPHSDALTAAGFAADAVAQLNAAADALDGAMADCANAKVRRVGATKGIDEYTAIGREAVRMLHGAIVSHFGDDATFLAAWRAAHRVTARPKAAKTIAVVPGTTPTPAPASPATTTPQPAPMSQAA